MKAIGCGFDAVAGLLTSYERFPFEFNDYGDAIKVPVLYIEVSPGPEQHLLFYAIMTRLGQPFRVRNSLAVKIKQVCALISTIGCRMLIIDEFQHVQAFAKTND